MFIRAIILFCLFHLLSMFHAEQLHREGLLLCRLKNLPHRGLGMLFFSHIKYPSRPDYLKDYILQYLEYTDQEMLLEGQKRPIVAMYSVAKVREFPQHKELQLLREIIMHNHFVRMREKEEKEAKQ